MQLYPKKVKYSLLGGLTNEILNLPFYYNGLYFKGNIKYNLFRRKIYTDKIPDTDLKNYWIGKPPGI
jgi:hypothetical protein